MARTDYDLLSTAPPDELGGLDGDYQQARAEAKRYINLIRKFCAPEPEGSWLKLRSNPHDLGTYYTVAYFFDDSIPDHIEYMKLIDSEGPTKWSDDEFIITMNGIADSTSRVIRNRVNAKITNLLEKWTDNDHKIIIEKVQQ